MRHGIALLEIMIAMVLAVILLGIGAPRVARALDATAVRAARMETTAALSTARDAAIARNARVAVLLDTARSAVVVAEEEDTIAVHSLSSELSVRLHASRDSIAFGPSGRGYGAANTTVILSRGAAAETVTVSRLGRVK